MLLLMMIMARMFQAIYLQANFEGPKMDGWHDPKHRRG